MKKWMLCNKTGDEAAISAGLGLGSIVTRMLINRGYDTVEKARAFLSEDISLLPNPLLLKDSEKATDIIRAKLDEGRSIRIIGDYDVDGVSSTYVLYDFLTRTAHATGSLSTISYRIPDRVKDGYGMNNAMIDEALSAGVDTIITCDNGIAAYDQVEYANQNGLTVIITDHHDIPEVLPRASAIVDPKQKDCSYPFKSICGAVVAAKICQLFFDTKLSDEERGRIFNTTVVEHYIINLSMATVCDVCPLENENRIIVSRGIRAIKDTDNLGLSALIEQCNLSREAISTYHMGYVLGPCFNATGRLAVADKALALLNSRTREEAIAAAIECKALNDDRKEMTKEWLGKAIEICEAEESGTQKRLADDRVLVIFLDGCHESLAGIIAGRLRERYSRPAIVLTRCSENLAEESTVKGSGRSIEAYNMFEEITKVSHLLSKFGGHPMAAGLSLPEANIAALRRELNENTSLSEDDLVEKLLIDAVVPFSMINEDTLTELELLEPFGAGNAKPVFAEKNMTVESARSIGRSTRYFKFKLSDSHCKGIDALYFGDFDELEKKLIDSYGQKAVDNMFSNRPSGITLTVAYYPQINEYNGIRTIQMVISDIL